MTFPYPVAAAPSPMPVVNEKLLLLGGDDGTLVNFQPIEKHPGFPGKILAFDGAWTEAGRIPAPRATVPVVSWREKFIIPSGEARPGVRSPEIWTFSPVSK